MYYWAPIYTSIFMLFMSNPLQSIQDIYEFPHKLWASTFIWWKQTDASVNNSHLYTFQKHSHTIQKSLNQARNLATATELLNLTLAWGKPFMSLQGEI